MSNLLKRQFVRQLIPVLALLLAIAPFAANATDEKSGEEQATIASLTEDSDRFEGLFTLYVDRNTGALRMLLEPEQLGREFVYVATVRDAPSPTGWFRGALGAFTKNGVILLRRHFDRVEFVEQNVNYYFDPANPISRAADANISPAVIAVAKIEAEDEATGNVLIDAGPVFLKDAFMQIKPSPDPSADPREPKFDLGTLSEAKTRISDWRTYPDNVDVFVEYVYENPAPVVKGAEDWLVGGSDVTDSRYVSIDLQHSFIALPDDDYVPRSDDPRVGYFSTRVTDLTSSSAAPWRDYIHRWHLEKKDRGAAVSDPVEPIVFWIENTTPYEYRDTIRDATLAWNDAFEQAGFSNAIEVQVQPDDADWDAGDIHYNVLRWTSSPNPFFGGFGPSFTHPRTGQILGADIMLEEIYMTSRDRYTKLFDATAREMSLESPLLCAQASHLQAGLQFGRAALKAEGADPSEFNELTRQGLYVLVMHEVGHALGLHHNFIASQLLPTDALYGDGVDTTNGYMTGSIMDYTPINVAPNGREQGLYYETDIGPYDFWAIEFGYAETLADPAAEQERLAQLLDRSTEPGLRFGNDADDMRTPGAGIDPRIMINDMSSDGIGYAVDRMQLVRELMKNLLGRYEEQGTTYQELVIAYQTLIGQYNGQAQAVSRYVGGVHVDRAVQGQSGATSPYIPVAAVEQRRAMATLAAYVFAPDALVAPNELYRHLQTERRQFDFFGKTEDPKIHDNVFETQKAALDHLLHAAVLKRLTDSALYGNDYAVADMMTELTDAVFGADMSGDVNSFRQNLQAEYVKRLAAMITPENAGGYDQPSRAMALYTLQALRRDLGGQRRGNTATKAHRAALVHTIDRALETTQAR